MRFLNDKVFTAQANASVNSSAIDASQMVSCSLQAVFTDAAATGTIKLQASNDHTIAGNLPAGSTVATTPTNWTDISGATVAVAGVAPVLINVTSLNYQWIRVVWTRTAGAGTFTATLKSTNF